jgi:hypothetical protein
MSLKQQVTTEEAPVMMPGMYELNITKSIDT